MRSFKACSGALASALTLVFPLLALAAPAVSRPTITPVSGASRAQEVVLPWGDAPHQIGYRPAGRDFPGEGVSSVAVAPDGGVWLLDRLNRRVIRVGGHGAQLVEAREVAADAEDLTIGPDGTLALYSPLRARVFLVDRHGPAGEIAVPRELEEVVGIGLAASRRVLLHTSYQETFSLGSPGAPQLLTAVRAHKREGAALLADGAGVAVVLRDGGRAELLVLTTGERTTERARFTVGRGVLAARIIGVAGDAVCLRLETELGGPALRVSRRVTCVDARSGQVLLNQELPAPGVISIRRELAVGGSPARVVHLQPAADGLHVRSFSLSRGGAR